MNIVGSLEPRYGGTSSLTGSDNLDNVIRKHVFEVLQQEGWNRVPTSKTLEISRRSQYRLIENFCL